MANVFLRLIDFPAFLTFDALITCRCQYDELFFSDQLFDNYGILLPDTIKKSVPKRRAEFLAGRLAAQHALRSAGSYNYHVPIGIQRVPVWPIPYIGSITHSNEIAICVLSRDNQLLGVGIDLERVITLELIETIHHTIISEPEYNYIKSLSIPLNIAITIAFSAKESFFKAAYSSVNDFFDFNAVSIIEIHPGSQESTFVLVVEHQLSNKLPRGHHIKGHFWFENDVVITLLSV